MRHMQTLRIALHWSSLFALLAVMWMLNPGHGIFAALNLPSAAPTPDAFFPGGAPLVGSFFSFALAIASLFFVSGLARAFFCRDLPRGEFVGSR